MSKPETLGSVVDEVIAAATKIHARGVNMKEALRMAIRIKEIVGTGHPLPAVTGHYESQMVLPAERHALPSFNLLEVQRSATDPRPMYIMQGGDVAVHHKTGERIIRNPETGLWRHE